MVRWDKFLLRVLDAQAVRELAQPHIAPVEPRYQWRYLVAFVHPALGGTVWYLTGGVSSALFSALQQEVPRRTLTGAA